MENENTITKPTAAEAAIAEHAHAAAAIARAWTFWKRKTSYWSWPTCRAPAATRST